MDKLGTRYVLHRVVRVYQYVEYVSSNAGLISGLVFVLLVLVLAVAPSSMQFLQQGVAVLLAHVPSQQHQMPVHPIACSLLIAVCGQLPPACVPCVGPIDVPSAVCTVEQSGAIDGLR